MSSSKPVLPVVSSKTDRLVYETAGCLTRLKHRRRVRQLRLELLTGSFDAGVRAPGFCVSGSADQVEHEVGEQ